MKLGRDSAIAKIGLMSLLLLSLARTHTMTAQPPACATQAEPAIQIDPKQVGELTTTHRPTACEVDFDRSGLVDVQDMMQVANRWRAHLGDPIYDTRYDLDRDGDIDVVDIMLVTVQWGAQYATWAENRSYSTTCAEEDNVNVPIFSFPGQMSRFRVVATHPTYEVGMDNCAPDFSGCGSGAGIAAPQTTNTCQKLWDDGTNVIEVCTEPSWWRPYSMSVVVDSQTASGHRLVLYRKIEGEASWPQFLVLYEDGNMRLKPHPPVGRSDVCFGSSVIIGPAAPAMRPYVDIQEVRIDPATPCLDIICRDGGTARLCLSVNRSQAVAEVEVGYNTGNPFATFRSMRVSDGNADVDHIENQDGDFPILDDWTCLRGPWWFFHRKARSTHNTSAPDIRIERPLLPVRGVYVQFERRGWASEYWSGQVIANFNSFDSVVGHTVAEEVSLQLDTMRQMGVNAIAFELRASDPTWNPGPFEPPDCNIGPALGLQWPQPTPQEMGNLVAFLDLVNSKGMKVFLRLVNTHMEEQPPTNNSIWIGAILNTIKDHPALELVLFEGNTHLIDSNGDGIVDTCGIPAEPPLWLGPTAAPAQYVKWAISYGRSLGLPPRKLSAEAIIGDFFVESQPPAGPEATDGHLWSPIYVLKSIFDNLLIPNDQRTYAVSFYYVKYDDR